MRETPASRDSEKSLLGCFLQQERLLDDVCEILTEDDWFYTENRLLYRVLLDMRQKQKAIDLITVSEAAKRVGSLDDIGGDGHVADCMCMVPAPVNWKNYASVIKEKAHARRAIAVANRILEAAYDPALEAENLQEVVQASLVECAGFTESKAATKSLKEILIGRIDHFEKLATNPSKLEGLPTGILPLDRAIRGLRPGNMIVLAAKTKGGKTTLALNIASNIANQGHPVGVFSLEMNDTELADRMIAAESGVDLSSGSYSGFSASSLNRIFEAIDNLGGAPLYIRDEAHMTPVQFQAAARKMVAQQKVKLIVLDYVQLLSPVKANETRERQVAEASRVAKITAAELGIPIIVLSQLSDEGRSRESRAIEQDSNIFAIIEEDEEGQYSLNIKHARDCARTRIPLTFRKECTRFEARRAS